VGLLDTAEWAHNLRVHLATKQTLIQLNTGVPVESIDSLCTEALSEGGKDNRPSSEQALEHLARIDKQRDEAKSFMLRVQEQNA